MEAEDQTKKPYSSGTARALLPERSPGTEERRCNANSKRGALYPSAINPRPEGFKVASHRFIQAIILTRLDSPNCRSQGAAPA